MRSCLCLSSRALPQNPCLQDIASLLRTNVGKPAQKMKRHPLAAPPHSAARQCPPGMGRALRPDGFGALRKGWKASVETLCVSQLSGGAEVDAKNNRKNANKSAQ